MRMTRSRTNARFAPSLAGPVPIDIVHRALDTARAAPSNANVKPQCVDVPVGDALTELPDAMLDGLQAATCPVPCP